MAHAPNRSIASWEKPLSSFSSLPWPIGRHKRQRRATGPAQANDIADLIDHQALTKQETSMGPARQEARSDRSANDANGAESESWLASWLMCLALINTHGMNGHSSNEEKRASSRYFGRGMWRARIRGPRS